MTTQMLLSVTLVAALASITSAGPLISPCPQWFHYDSTDQPGQWTGTLTVLSEYQLHGVWIRLIFDKKLNDVLVAADGFGEVVHADNNEILIKNKEVLLKPGTSTNIRIVVKYEGNNAPVLLGYRLNAKNVCPPESAVSGDPFLGDIESQDFLASIVANKKESEFKEDSNCGTAPLTDAFQSSKSGNGQWPWQAAIYIQTDNREQFACEATLISPKHLLTSAHCVAYQKTEEPVSPQKLIVYVGKPSLSGEGKEKLHAQEITLYPGYQSKDLLNDIAVIELHSAATVTDFVRPICLGKAGGRNDGFLVGFGLNPDRKISDLTQTKVKIVSGDECSKYSSLKGLVSDNGICARYVEDNSVCVGASGSGLTSLREGPKAVWELRGVVTLGVTLQDKYVCDQSSTVLLQDISKYLKWIQAVVS